MLWPTRKVAGEAFRQTSSHGPTAPRRSICAPRWLPLMIKQIAIALEGGLVMRSHHRSPFMETLESRQLLSQMAAGIPDELRAEPDEARPNVLFILTDDLDLESVQYMPRVRELIGERGVTFENAFVTNPVCCPSNVTVLTGQ